MLNSASNKMNKSLRSVGLYNSVPNFHRSKDALQASYMWHLKLIKLDNVNYERFALNFHGNHWGDMVHF